MATERPQRKRHRTADEKAGHLRGPRGKGKGHNVSRARKVNKGALERGEVRRHPKGQQIEKGAEKGVQRRDAEQKAQRL